MHDIRETEKETYLKNPKQEKVKLPIRSGKLYNSRWYAFWVFEAYFKKIPSKNLSLNARFQLQQTTRKKRQREIQHYKTENTEPRDSQETCKTKKLRYREIRKVYPQRNNLLTYFR